MSEGEKEFPGSSEKGEFLELNEQTQFLVEDQENPETTKKLSSESKAQTQTSQNSQIFIPQNPASSQNQFFRQDDNQGQPQASGNTEIKPGQERGQTVENFGAKFHTIIDVESEISKNNFEPLVLCLKNNYVDKNFIDRTGYNFLHHVTSFKNKPLIRMLVEKFAIDINIKSANGQTPLMIAANFGFIDILKYFLDLNCEVDLVDSCKFNALLYAVKQCNVSTFIALIHKGSQIDISDVNNCSVVHWASYKNSLWLLRLFKRLNMDLFTRDNHNFTPLQRAISNDSYDCVYFLGEEQDIRGIITYDDLEKTKSRAIRSFLKKKLDPEANKTFEDYFWQFWDGKPKVLSFICYLVFLFKLTYHYLNYISTPTMNDYFFMNVSFSVLLLYFYVYILWFIFRLKSPSRNDFHVDQNFKQYQNEYFKGVTIEDIKRVNFHFINKLLERSGMTNTTTYQSSYGDLDHSTLELMSSQGEERPLRAINSEQEFSQFTFLHIIAYLIERNRFTEVLEIDYERFCPTCLQYKPPKTKHVPKLGVCINYYNHYSRIFNTHFNFKNHIYYLILLTLQEALLVIFLLLHIFVHSERRKSYSFLMVFETAYIMLETSFSSAFFFMACLVLLFYNSMFLFIENYGIVNNLTYSEIFQRHRYRYLFKTHVDSKGKAWKVYINTTSQGFGRNISNYIKRSFS